MASRSGTGIISIREIRDVYPNEWIALAIAETDADGFAARGEVITHDADERFVWSAIKLREPDEPRLQARGGPGEQEQEPGGEGVERAGVARARARASARRRDDVERGRPCRLVHEDHPARRERTGQAH